MEYNLDALSDRQFERLSQALVHKYVGPSVSVFGDGPDGGREATWNGPAPALSDGQAWNGYGVLQAKKCEHPSQKPVDNERWFLQTIGKELRAWAKKGSKRATKPDYLLLSTNVRLSPSPGAGIDRVNVKLKELIDHLKLPIKAFKVWHYDEFQTMLDQDNKIYSSFAAWVTPGDLIARLIKDQFDAEEEFSTSLRAHAAKSLIDDHYLNLTQAGNVADKPISVADVFIDLPVEGGFWVGSRKIRRELPRRGRIVETLIARANADHHDQGGSSDETSSQIRSVLVGGPGQGKSTVTQFLAQVYRAEFIRDSPSARPAEVASALASLDARLEHLGIPRPSARRWPVRVILTELADSLERGECDSLLGFIARSVSRRADAKIGVATMRRWLRSFPWIVFIDGLDEVPASSNRAAVLAAIRDFEIEVATAEGDVSTIATTRPQGYNDEFSPEYHRHFTLARLSEEIALEYASGLISIRSGQGTEASRRTMLRLERATQDETTSRLFSSPLQVTILTVLIERVGQVPRDRWRLFSDYYRVIYQREQEKGGELSDLLREFEADVHFIHREIGYILQGRSAVAGETSSYITKDEFDECIRRRLTNQQHEVAEVDRLTADFSRLVVERLVFLAVVKSENIGFELRSIQEFMAAEFITSQPESRVLTSIKEIAPVSHWRNTVLFAFGRIFAEKEHLKAEAVQILEQLNWELDHAQILRTGSNIALDILLDGSCHSQPIYARPLAERACALFDGPLMVREKDFARLREGHVGTIIRDKALSLAPAHLSYQLNRILVLARLADAGDTQASAALKSALIEGDRQLATAAARLARIRADTALTRAVQEVLPLVPPSELIDINLPRELLETVSQELPEEAPAWLKAAHALEPDGFPDEGMFQARDCGQLHITARRIQSHSSHWEELESVGGGGSNWAMADALALFSRVPSEQTLAGALEAAADSGDARLLEHAAWPLAACYSSALNRAAYLQQADAKTAWLRTLAAMARDGMLGNVEAWLATEEFWDAAPTFAELASGRPLMASDSFGSWSIPIGKQTNGVPATLLGLRFFFAYPRSGDALDEVLDAVAGMLDTLPTHEVGDQFLCMQALALFIAGAVIRSNDDSSRDEAPSAKFMTVEQSRDIANRLASFFSSETISEGFDSFHVGWLELFNERPEIGKRLLRMFGSARGLAKVYSPAGRSRLTRLDLWGLGETDECSSWRLLAHVNTELFTKHVDELSATCDCDDRSFPSHRRFRSFVGLAKASSHDLQQGNFDSEILEVCWPGPDNLEFEMEALDSVNGDLLAMLAESKGSVGVSLAARTAQVLAPSAPLLAFAFASLTERLSKESEPTVTAN
ncbi:hypothetical protein QWJ39_03500 [Arthrobacter sp. YD4]|uniref:NACHT domain-containing protein n=1 Tax=Arthrobacter sp. YD4 TaxID=3058043 RepID=UPI0025B2D489|nr:hypothetical protein [Arthrobacter sp. YD4]MDN3935381.1 hypothetical protein [Arthrobacter sp. YD4]